MVDPLSLVLPLRDGIRSRRAARCPDCWLPLPACVCADLPRIATRTRVVIIMHSMEAKRTSNTGRLAARVLAADVRMRGARDSGPREALPEGRRLLLFPAAGARVLSREDVGADRPLLLVPDGNWRQAGKVITRDEDAVGAEVVTLPSGPPGRYHLRRAPNAAALCTYEAIARALAILESPSVGEEMMRALDLFVQRTMVLRGTPFAAEFD